jgi:hypothetical protein
MFKLPAVIRNHFVLVPYFEAKAASSRSSKEILVPIAKAAPGISSRSPSAVFPDPSTALRTRLRSAEIETTPPSSVFSFVSSAGKAPAVCAQLQKIGR